LDGLRAFAVLAVIAYHFGFVWAPGGLLGVTVFFVLSGYLITSLLLAEWSRTKSIDLKAFWLRRVKRLVPAIVFLLVCITVLCAIFNHDLLTKMRPDTPPALFFYSNWWYIFRDVSYFETLGAPSPLTHFWSLAIEEQFYLVWPVFMAIFFGLGAKRKVFTRISLVIALVSVLLMAFFYNPNADPSRVYYGTDTRAFSLLIGAVLAFAWPSNQLAHAHDFNLSRPVRVVFDGVGIAALVGLFAMVGFVDGFSPFMYRGGVLLASLLTAVVIAVMVHPTSVLGKAAAVYPLVWIGKRSYGIYLWHYPITLLMTPSNFTGETAWWYYLIELAVILACAAFSFRFIEDPIRKGAIGRLLRGLRSGSFSLAGYLRNRIVPFCAAGVLVAASVACFVAIPSVSAVADLDAMEQRGTTYVPPTKDADPAIPKRVLDIVLIGDSVSMRAIPYFEATFPNGVIDSAVNRQIWEGVEVYDYYYAFGEVGNIVVFALGTNSPVIDEQIDELVEAVGLEKSIYLVNTRSPQNWVTGTNETLARAAERYANVHLIDWFSLSADKDSLFDGDGTHLTEEGAQVYVEMVRQATGLPLPVQDGTSGGSEGALEGADAGTATDEAPSEG
jgi:peptidoglycan/LPS O-acetylase OafA/YrhL